MKIDRKQVIGLKIGERGKAKQLSFDTSIKKAFDEKKCHLSAMTMEQMIKAHNEYVSN